MAISARNIFRGQLTAVREGAVNAEVELTTAGGDRIVAIVTDGSVKSLGLAKGKEAVAVVKAPWVTLMNGAPEFRFSARNQLTGKVAKLARGAVNCQVKLSLAGGSLLSAVVTNEAADEMGLAVGSEVVALIKASHVLIGVPV